MATVGRSPNYPALTLEEAIEQIRKVYDAQHHYPATKEVVAQNLGYGGINGKSLAFIGALKRYALLQADGENLRVSDDAISILTLPQDDPARTAALKRAAFATPIFAQLYETYGNKPPADAVLRHELVKKKFLQKAADEAIRIYRDNLELVTRHTQDYNADRPTDSRPEERQHMQTLTGSIRTERRTPDSMQASSPHASLGKGVYEFSFPLSFQRDVKAVITLYGEKIKRRDLEFLKRKVDDLLEGFEDEEPEPQPEPEPKPAPIAESQLEMARSRTDNLEELFRDVKDEQDG